MFGPIVGSLVAEAYNWRAAFLMIVPPGLVAMACIWLTLGEHRERSRAHFDWTGFLALPVAITGFQLMIDRGQRLDWFESSEIRLYSAVAGVAF